MGGNFTHFFLGAKVDSERSGVFGEQGWEPGLVFVWIRPAEAGFDGYWQVGVCTGIAITLDGEVGSLNHGGAAAGFVDVFVGATEI